MSKKSNQFSPEVRVRAMRPRGTISVLPRYRKQRATEPRALAQNIAGVDVPGSERVDPVETPYFRRKLRVVEEASEREILDSDLLGLERSVVVLGEPGMGKSELIGELGRAGGVAPVSALRFMQSKNPGGYVTSGHLLLIDGLDEAIARDEKDALDRVLAQLEDAGCPRFVLSCRSREWQSRSLRSLKEIYGAEPFVVSIEQFTREEACAFWSSRGFTSSVDAVLDGLDEQGLSDLYRNPLTLCLLGRVADSGKPLPATRAVLFGHVCELIWREENDARQNTQLAQINQEQALSSAGACMAAMIFGGVDAIRLGGIAERQEGEVWIGDLENLPGGAHARSVVASKLFKNVGVGRVAPIHRVIAECSGRSVACRSGDDQHQQASSSRPISRRRRGSIELARSACLARVPQSPPLRARHRRRPLRLASLRRDGPARRSSGRSPARRPRALGARGSLFPSARLGCPLGEGTCQDFSRASDRRDPGRRGIELPPSDLAAGGDQGHAARRVPFSHP